MRIPSNPNHWPRARRVSQPAAWLRAYGLLFVALLLLLAAQPRLVRLQERDTSASYKYIVPVPTLRPAKPSSVEEIGQPTEGALLAVVALANNTFIRARSQSNSELLVDVAAGNWLQAERMRIATLREQGMSEAWRQLEFQVQRVSIGDDDHAAICTVEGWSRTTDQNASLASEELVLAFSERYALVRMKAQWFVEDISYDDDRCL